ncbi:patatin-like phospholipase RssA [Alcaligenaceae bacterium]|nr:patatin-like phospholipase RssA [Alcaligenaceae bacterium]
MGTHQRKPRLGLVLGSGSARGWAHIGIIQTLEQAGLRPDIICGTSIGALVGAAYAVGEINRFEKWVLGLRIKDIVSFMDLHLNGGMLKGERLMAFFRDNFIDSPVEALNIPFGAVATALHTGNEVWLRTGSAVGVVRASIALPGLFSPVWHDGQLLVDGGLVNPVPVSLARAMGAEVIIAVDLNSDILSRHLNHNEQEDAPGPISSAWMRRLQQNLNTLLPEPPPDAQRLPSVLDVVATSLNIMQVRITRSRMAGDPPDIVISPRLAHLGLLDFHRAQAAIDEGRRAATASLPQLVELGLIPQP